MRMQSGFGQRLAHARGRIDAILSQHPQLVADLGDAENAGYVNQHALRLPGMLVRRLRRKPPFQI